MNQPLLSLSAADLMSRNLVIVPQDMSLPGAARMLSRAQVSGAPVVDGQGRCIGVLSATDFLRCVEKGSANAPGSECVCQAWQILESDHLPKDAVRHYMTSDPVVVAGNIRIGELAQMMINAHIHRVIVVDPNDRPIGIVSSTDILAAVAREARAKEIGTEYRHPVSCDMG